MRGLWSWGWLSVKSGLSDPRPQGAHSIRRTDQLRLCGQFHQSQPESAPLADEGIGHTRFPVRPDANQKKVLMADVTV